MNALPNPQTNGIAGLLQGNAEQGNVPQAGTSGPNPMAQVQQPQQAPQQQRTPLDPKLIQAFEDMKLRAAAQRQQAMQTPQQPPVVQQLAQQAQGIRQQTVPQEAGRTVPGMAAGGVVALAGGGPAWANMQREPGETPEEFVARVEAAKRSAFEGYQKSPLDIWKALRTYTGPGAYPQEPEKPAALKPPSAEGQRLRQTDESGKTQTYSGPQLPDEALAKFIYDARNGGAESLRFLTAYTAKYPLHAMQVSGKLDKGVLVPEGTQASTSQGPLPSPTPGAPQPAARPQTPPAQAAQPQAPASGLDALLEAGIKKGLDTDLNKERDTQSDWYAQKMGMAPLLAQQEARLKGIEDLYGKMRKPGIEDWLTGLANTAPGNNPAAGLGAAGQSFLKAQDASQARDVDFATKMAGMRDAAMKLQMEGNKGAADAGIKGLDEARRTQQNALTQGVGLESKREATQQRRDAAQLASQDRALQRQLAEQGRGAQLQAEQIRAAHNYLASIDAEVNKLQADPLTATDPQRVKQLAELKRQQEAVRRALGNFVPGLAGALQSNGAGSTTLTPEMKKRALEISAGK